MRMYQHTVALRKKSTARIFHGAVTCKERDTDACIKGHT
ncbi:hypothetical protein TPChic_0437a [Treponema pallidum subsp. pallidum str. Chicago]|nr:hypothetical protein TPChic_0437a [Treponema pallidum subsp. pallidum str. Chicago]